MGMPTMRSESQSALKKVTMRLIPFLLLLYVVAYIDRSNISFAALEMNATLGFDASVYGLAAGMFFVGYFIFEVPSNILLAKFGAKVWISRILLTWGVVVILTGFVQSATQLHILRFLLGLAEAGLFPGLIYYMTYWFPKKSMAKYVAMFMSAIPLAFVLGGPISGWLIDNFKGLGLEGWRWMFIIEGAAAVVLAPITYFYLTDSPEKARWLTAEEKQALRVELNAEEITESNKQDHSSFSDPTVWYLSVLYFFYMTGTLGLLYFLPQIIQKLSVTSTATQVGLISAIPYFVGGLLMNLWARRSDKKGERYLHAAAPLLIVIASYIVIIYGLTSIPSMLVALTVAVVGLFAFYGPFWSIPAQLLSRKSSAAGIAIINSCGGLGGFAGPYLMGYLAKTTGNNNLGFSILSVFLGVSVIMLIYLKIRKSNVSLNQGQLPSSR